MHYRSHCMYMNYSYPQGEDITRLSVHKYLTLTNRPQRSQVWPGFSGTSGWLVHIWNRCRWIIVVGGGWSVGSRDILLGVYSDSQISFLAWSKLPNDETSTGKPVYQKISTTPHLASWWPRSADWYKVLNRFKRNWFGSLSLELS